MLYLSESVIVTVQNLPVYQSLKAQGSVKEADLDHLENSASYNKRL